MHVACVPISCLFSHTSYSQPAGKFVGMHLTIRTAGPALSQTPHDARIEILYSNSIQAVVRIRKLVGVEGYGGYLGD